MVEVGLVMGSKTCGGGGGEGFLEQTKSGLGCGGDRSITLEDGEEGIGGAGGCGLVVEGVGESMEVGLATCGEWRELWHGGRVIRFGVEIDGKEDALSWEVKLQKLDWANMKLEWLFVKISDWMVIRPCVGYLMTSHQKLDF